MDQHKTRAGYGLRTQLCAGTYPKRTKEGCYENRDHMYAWCAQNKWPQANPNLAECAGKNYERLFMGCLHDNKAAGWWKNFAHIPGCTGDVECYNSRPALTPVEGAGKKLISPWVKDVALE